MAVIRVGTRGSRLARAQTQDVLLRLKNRIPELSFETVIIQSSGDRIKDRPIHELNCPGAFTSELERALLDGEIDFAVHSMKDLPAELPAGLCLAACPKRADGRDALVLEQAYDNLASLPSGAAVGTGSIRRALQLLRLRPDLHIVPIRGNIDTRLAMVGRDLNGVVLAAAGLCRIGLADRISESFAPELFVPAPAQGILAVELRRGNTGLRNMLESIADTETTLSARAERAFLRECGAGCHAPVGAYSVISGQQMTLYGIYGEENRGRYVKGQIKGAAVQADELGQALARLLLEKFQREEFV